MWTPRAKQRPKTTWQNGHARTFTPRETVAAELALAQQWVGLPIEGPIAVSMVMSDVDIYISISHAPEPESAKLRRGDIDNYTKLICDALNGVAWIDDRQIAQLTVRKL